MLLFLIFVFLLGLCFGSFFTSLVFRLEKGEKIFLARSHCPHCLHPLSFFDLIPLFSFIFLKGKCRYCQKPISFFYPLVEIISGFLFLFAFFLSDNFFHFLFLAFVFSSLFLIFLFDLRDFWIPQEIIFPLIIISLFYLFFQLPFNQFLISHLLTGFLLFLFFFSFYFFSKGKLMGQADSYLAFFLGIFWGFPKALFSLFLALFFGFCFSLIMIALRKKTLKSEIPFAPFLILGFLANFFVPLPHFLN